MGGIVLRGGRCWALALRMRLGHAHPLGHTCAMAGLMLLTDWDSVCTLACRVPHVHLRFEFKLVYTAAWFG